MKALELADTLEAVSIDPGLCHHTVFKDILNAAAELRRLAAVEAERDALKRLYVSNILIDVVPGEDGMSREVYAQSTDQVVEVLTKLSEQCDTLQMERDALKAELEAEREESKRWLVKAQNERDARKELEAELERIKANPVHQWRKPYCADWFDGHPDHADGGGPYETRTLYALGSKTDD